MANTKEVLSLNYLNNHKKRCVRKPVSGCSPKGKKDADKVIIVKKELIVKAPRGENGRRGSSGRRGPQGPVGPVGPAGPYTAGGTGPAGPAGPVGPAGAVGAVGPAGATGATGATGPASGGAMIPFASGAPITATTVAGGLVGTVSLIGFGISLPGVVLTGTSIDLTGSVVGGPLFNYAFSVPRDGLIDSISAFFSNTATVNLLTSSVTLTAQLYSAPLGDNLFNPVAGAAVTFAPITGLLALGETRTGTAPALAIPVTAGTRLLMVYSADTADLALAAAVVGYASAGVSII
ncbi:exosporium glycoprotein BclB-related protein [Paenibacillus sp. PL91]|uniref:exosporium glycoprotein BclB-related protein n=1 Tax=Paenibacillus sp. PL91 TaxID=2729538 RepID=UPI00145E992E|nr:exosporium glycoprotein BclB-related protein [Paenibacillus sp. PL91]MBC9201302.1 bclB domain-containing protein [Paenibacillus sp. PL91]